MALTDSNKRVEPAHSGEEFCSKTCYDYVNILRGTRPFKGKTHLLFHSREVYTHKWQHINGIEKKKKNPTQKNVTTGEFKRFNCEAPYFVSYISTGKDVILKIL